jgi:hypothetical protein
LCILLVYIQLFITVTERTVKLI